MTMGQKVSGGMLHHADTSSPGGNIADRGYAPRGDSPPFHGHGAGGPATSAAGYSRVAATPSSLLVVDEHLIRPSRLDVILSMPPPPREIQEAHSWNPDDRSLNIFVKDD